MTLIPAILIMSRNPPSCESVLEPKATEATQSHPKATPRPHQGHILGIDSGVQGHTTATPRLPQGSTKAPPRLHQGYFQASSSGQIVSLRRRNHRFTRGLGHNAGVL